MSLPSVGQAPLLAGILRALVLQHRPRAVLVAGCSGGNGLAEIAAPPVERIVGVDLNPEYIRVAKARLDRPDGAIQLVAGDFTELDLGSARFDLVYAALVLEYVPLDSALQAFARATRAGGILAALLQQASLAHAAVTPTPFTSLGALGGLMRLVDVPAFRVAAARSGWRCEGSERHVLPSGKAFVLETLRRTQAVPAD